MSIKPCPWCGAKGKTLRHKSTYDNKYYYSVICLNPSCNSKTGCSYRPRKAAIESWNGNDLFRDSCKTFSVPNFFRAH